MIAVVSGLAAAALVVWAAMRMNVRIDRIESLRTDKSERRPVDPFRMIGFRTARFVGRFVDLGRFRLTEREIRSGGVALVVCISLSIVSPYLTVIVVGSWILHVWTSRRRFVTERKRAIVRELPMTVDLLRLAVQSGLNITAAVTEVAAHTDGPLADELRLALLDVGRGKRLADALDAMAQRTGEELRPLIWSLTSTERYGAPLTEVLERLAHETRIDQERRYEQAAKRLSVQLLFPVAGTTLPAFALLTVVPLIAGSIPTLASNF